MATRRELIAELQRLADELGTTPRATDMNNEGAFYTNAYQDQFGTWNEAIEAAGLTVNQKRATNKTVEDFIEDLQRVADKAGRVPRRGDAGEYGKWGTTTYQQRVPDNNEKSNWNTVLKQAGFEPYYEVRDTITKQCDNCDDDFEIKPYWDHVRFCSRDCYFEWRTGRYTGKDSWSYNSVEVDCDACGATLERIQSHVDNRDHNFCDHDCYAEWMSEHKTGEDAFHWQGGPITYGEGWDKEKREQVRERDDYRCQACGKTQADELEDIGRKLSVHHIKPAKQVDAAKERNAMDNLVTLCLSCHMKWEGVPLKPTLTD